MSKRTSRSSGTQRATAPVASAAGAAAERWGQVRPVWWAALVFGATLVAYLPALRAGLVWNDRDYVTSPGLQSFDGLARIWFEVGATEQYYPLLHSAFWIEHQLWGDAAFGYHLVNILLHATSACFVALILRRLTIPGAWLAALVFALHPVCVESVAWISEQKNTLSAAFYLAALIGYLRFDEQRSPRRYALASICFALALLTKSVAATLPAALLVIAWWRHGRLEWKRQVGPLVPWLVAGVAAGLFTGWVEKEIGGAKGVEFQLTLVERTLVAGRAIWFYLGKLLWPVDLNFIYPRWTVNGGEAWQYLYPAAAVALIVALWRVRQRWRGPLAAVLFFAGSLFPVLGFFNVYAFVFSFVADHWQYLPSLGIIVLAAAAIVEGLRRIPAPRRWPGRVLIAAIVGLLGAQTWRQCRTYHDMLTFYQTIIDRNPACWMAHYNLGNALRTAGRTQEALLQYEQALQANPNMPDAQTALGLALEEAGRGGEALAHYEEAVRLDPQYTDALNHLGIALARAGRRPEAIAHYEQALHLNPALAEVHNNLGNVLRAAGRLPEALAHYRQALRLKPDFAQAHNNLGSALTETDRLPEAIAQFEESLRLDPAEPEVHNNLGIVLLMAGRTPDGIAHFEEALRLNPNQPQIHLNLAMALESVGRMTEATAHYESARRLGAVLPPPRQ